MTAVVIEDSIVIEPEIVLPQSSCRDLETVGRIRLMVFDNSAT